MFIAFAVMGILITMLFGGGFWYKHKRSQIDVSVEMEGLGRKEAKIATSQESQGQFDEVTKASKEVQQLYIRESDEKRNLKALGDNVRELLEIMKEKQGSKGIDPVQQEILKAMREIIEEQKELKGKVSAIQGGGLTPETGLTEQSIRDIVRNEVGGAIRTGMANMGNKSPVPSPIPPASRVMTPKGFSSSKESNYEQLEPEAEEVVPEVGATKSTNKHAKGMKEFSEWKK